MPRGDHRSSRVTWSRRDVAGAVAGVAAWCVLVELGGYFALNLVLRCVLAFRGFCPGYRLIFPVSWKALALLLVVAATVTLTVALLRAARARGVRRVSGAGVALVAILLLAGQAAWYCYDAEGSSNRWGFRRSWEAEPITIDHGWPEFPPMEIVANSHGYRDDEWPLPPADDGPRRVLLVGDSHVFGHGIPNKSGMLDAALERHLNAKGTERWDVWNVANHPSAMWYFAEAVIRIAPDMQPDYVVVSVFPGDVTFLDEQRALADLPQWFYVLDEAGDGFFDLVYVQQQLLWPETSSEIMADPEVVADCAAAFERLLDFTAVRDLPVIVWEARGSIPFFDPYRGRPGLTFLDWRSEIGAVCENLTWCEWGRDPAYAYPDGHPLPVTNGLIAEVLARAIHRLATDPSICRRVSGAP